MKVELPVSLVIPTYNRLHNTRNLLDSLKYSDFSCEIIIIDDHSSDNIFDLVKSYESFLNIIYFQNEKNSGPAYSRNKGIELASHDYIAFTDNDCISSFDWLIRLFEYISNASPNIAGVGGRTLAHQKDTLSRYYEYNKILDPWFYNGKCLYLVTANSIFKKDILVQVGGFDSNILKAGGEDVGLCFKILNCGYDLLYNPEAIIYHCFQNSILNFYKTFFRYGFGSRIQYDKYYKENKYKNQYFAGLFFNK